MLTEKQPQQKMTFISCIRWPTQYILSISSFNQPSLWPSDRWVIWDCFHHWKDRTMSLLAQTLYSDYGFASSNVMLPLKLPSMDSFYGIPHSITSDQGTHLKTKGMRYSAHGIHWLYMVLPHLEVAGFIKRWNGLLKTQSQCQLDSNSLQC